jgi:hypothetical protein
LAIGLANGSGVNWFPVSTPSTGWSSPSTRWAGPCGGSIATMVPPSLLTHSTMPKLSFSLVSRWLSRTRSSRPVLAEYSRTPESASESRLLDGHCDDGAACPQRAGGA